MLTWQRNGTSVKENQHLVTQNLKRKRVQGGDNK